MDAKARLQRRSPTPIATAPPDPPGLLLDLGLQLHMVAILLLSAHFRKIVRGIDQMINGDGKQDPADRRASTSRFKVPWDIVFMVAIVGLILLGSIAAILSGLFSLGDVFTLLLTAAWVIILVGLGLWFRYYANKVISMMKGSTGLSKGLMDRIDRLSSNARQHVRRRWLSTSGEVEAMPPTPRHQPWAPGPIASKVADSTAFGHPGPSRRHVPDGLRGHRRPPRRSSQPPSRGRWLGLLGWALRCWGLLHRHFLLLGALPDEGLPGASSRAEAWKGKSQAEQDRRAERQLSGHPADEQCMTPRTSLRFRARTQHWSKTAPRALPQRGARTSRFQRLSCPHSKPPLHAPEPVPRKDTRNNEKMRERRVLLFVATFVFTCSCQFTWHAAQCRMWTPHLYKFKTVFCFTALYTHAFHWFSYYYKV